MLWYNTNSQKIDWNAMYIYIDDSGSINNKLETDFIITLVATYNKDSLKKSYKRFVSSNLEELREADKRGQMFLNGKFKELKGSAFTPDLKVKFVEHFVKNDNFKLFYIHVHNSKLTDLFCSNTARVFNYNVRLALEAFIRRGLIPSEDHHLIIDERNIRTDSKGVLKEYLLTELVFGGINNGNIKINYVDSSNVPLVQIADVFSNLKFSRVVSDNENYETEFQKLEESVLKMTFNFPKSES